MNKKTVNQSPLDEVYATREGRSQVFKRIIWDALGPNHQGWEETKALPKELKAEQNQTDGVKGNQSLVITADNVYEYMKAVSLYIFGLSPADQKALSDQLFEDADIIKLKELIDEDDQEDGKDTQAQSSSNQAEGSAVVKKLNAAQQKKADKIANEQSQANGENTSAIVTGDLSQLANQANDTATGSTDADELAKSLANQAEGNTDGENN